MNKNIPDMIKSIINDEGEKSGGYECYWVEETEIKNVFLISLYIDNENPIAACKYTEDQSIIVSWGKGKSLIINL